MKKPFEITINDAIAWLEALQRTMQDRIPVRFAQIIRRNVVALSGNPDVAAAIPTRVDLVKKYGRETDPKTHRWEVFPERFQEFAAEWEQIAAQKR